MSRFSGKCDFCDHLWMSNTEEEILDELKKSNIYIYSNGRRHLLAINTIKDAVKYYPYLISSAAWSKDTACIILSPDSFIDEEERDHLQWRIDEVLKYYKKCKRNKTVFKEDECYENTHFGVTTDDALKEIISRVSKDGLKVKLEGIHLPMQEYYRRYWFDEMVKQGYDEFTAFCWCFNEFFPTSDTIEKRLGRK